MTIVSPTVKLNLITGSGPPQGTPSYHRHLQCRAGRFPCSNEADSYDGRATQTRWVSTEEPNELCPTMTGQKRFSRSATPTLLGLGVDHSHTRKNNVDSETK